MTAATRSSEDALISLAADGSIAGSIESRDYLVEIHELQDDSGARWVQEYSILDIEVAAASGDIQLAPNYVIEVDDSCNMPFFDLEAIDVSEYRSSLDAGVHASTQSELLSRKQLLEYNFPSRDLRYGVSDSNSNATIQSGSSSISTVVTLLLLAVVVVCIVVFLPFGNPKDMCREWMYCRGMTGDDRLDQKSKQKTPMSLADAIGILDCAADKLLSMVGSWFDASTDPTISLSTLRLLVTSLERELSLGVGLDSHTLYKRTRSDSILNKLDVLLTKLIRDKSAMSRRLAIHATSEKKIHVDDRVEMFLRMSELSCVVGDLAAVRDQVVKLQGVSEHRHLLRLVDRLKAAISERDVSDCAEACYHLSTAAAREMLVSHIDR